MPCLPAAVLGVVVASSSLWSAPVRAQAPTRSAPVALAERYAAEAFEAYQRRDHGRAVHLYQQALATAPSADIAYNIARVYDLGLHDASRAIEYYERYIQDPGAVTARVETARARLDALRAAQHASAKPASAELASEATGAPDAGLLEIARDFPLEASEPALRRPPSTPRNDGLSPLETAALTLGSMGIVGVGIGVGFGLAAQARSDEWRRDCDGNACNSRRGVDAAESATRSATVATVGFAAGGGLLALGAALWLIDSGRKRPETTGALHVEPFVRSAGGGTLVRGSF